ncbi:transcription factor Adf-1-like [Toxorhynchites rutilus septentrionalis]|uniref:transcription factor Adf-1-like n=1 Tax=Toxorhynchites rutilus septentrionalis TaxID=329112 RepID=UPI00247A3C3D|nr:transcription factor Adf-1-like [Toxorhynchites rutilus septentrionalis]
MDIELLISLIRRRPALWNQGSKLYNNRDVAKQAWKEVADELDSSEETVRKKWRGLRDTFRKELLKLEAKRAEKGDDSEVKCKWHCFKNMMFIKDQFVPRKPSGNEQPVASQVILFPEASCDYESELQPSPDITESEDSSTSYEQPPSALPVNRASSKRKNSNQKRVALHKTMKLEEQKPKLLEQRSQPPQDDDHYFCLSLVPYMRQLPIHRKMSIRAKFNEILAHEYEAQHSGLDHQQQLAPVSTSLHHSTPAASPSQIMASNEPSHRVAYEGPAENNFVNKFEPDDTF